MCSPPPTVLDIMAMVAMMSLHRKATADTAAICPSRFSQPASIQMARGTQGEIHGHKRSILSAGQGQTRARLTVNGFRRGSGVAECSTTAQCYHAHHSEDAAHCKITPGSRGSPTVPAAAAAPPPPRSASEPPKLQHRPLSPVIQHAKGPTLLPDRRNW